MWLNKFFKTYRLALKFSAGAFAVSGVLLVGDLWFFGGGVTGVTMPILQWGSIAVGLSHGIGLSGFVYLGNWVEKNKLDASVYAAKYIMSAKEAMLGEYKKSKIPSLAALISPDIIDGNISQVKKQIQNFIRHCSQPLRKSANCFSTLMSVTLERRSALLRSILPMMTFLNNEHWRLLLGTVTKVGCDETLEAYMDFFKEQSIFPKRDILILYNQIMIAAAALGHNDIIKTLIKKLGDDLPVDKEYQSYPDGKENHYSMLIFLINDFKIITTYPNTLLISPMHSAALCGQTETIEILYRAGFNPNLRTQSGGITPLMLAVYGRQQDTVTKMLSFHEIDIAIKDDRGEHVLDHVYSSILYLNPKKQRPYENVVIIKELLKKGSHLLTERLDYALGLSNHTEILELLLPKVNSYAVLYKAIFEATVTTRNSTTALFLLEELNKRIRKRLTEEDSKFHNKHIKEIWSCAACAGLDCLISPLINMGCEINAYGVGGKTALIIAVENQNLNFIESLLKLNADANLASQQAPGNTALMVASETGYYSFLQLLQQRNIKINVNVSRKEDQKTALTLAASAGFDNSVVITSLIQDFKADIHARCAENKTALEIAICKKQAANIYPLLLAEMKKKLNFPEKSKEGVTTAHAAKSSHELKLNALEIFVKFLSCQTLVIPEDGNPNEELIIELNGRKFNDPFSMVPLEIKQIILSIESIKKIVEWMAQNPAINKDQDMAAFIYEQSAEKKKFDYEILEHTIFAMPEKLSESIDPWTIEAIKRVKLEIEQDLQTLGNYVKNPGLKSNAERRTDAKKNEIAALNKEFNSIQYPNADTLVKQLPAAFNKLYDETHLTILDDFRAGNLDAANKQKLALEKLLNECQTLQEKFKTAYFDLLNFKSKVKGSLIKHSSGIKSQKTEQLNQEKERAAEERQKALKKESPVEDNDLQKEKIEKEAKLKMERETKRKAWLQVKEARRKEVEARDLALKQEKQKLKEEREKKKQYEKNAKENQNKTLPAKASEQNGASFLEQFYSNRDRMERLIKEESLSAIRVGEMFVAEENAADVFQAFCGKRPTIATLADISSIEHLVGKKEELDRLESIIQTLHSPNTKKDQKISVEDIMIIRYALLGTVARLMEHIMKVNDVNGFPADIAKQFRDAIFHRLPQLYNINLLNIKENIGTNEDIIDMTLKIIVFIKNPKANKLHSQKMHSHKKERLATAAIAAASTIATAAEAEKEYEESINGMVKIIDSKLFGTIVNDTKFTAPSSAACVNEIGIGKDKLKTLITTMSNQNHLFARNLDVMNAAIGFIFGKLGTFAAGLKQTNFNEFKKNETEYERYISLGNEFRHGKTYTLEKLATAALIEITAVPKENTKMKLTKSRAL